MTYDVYLLSPAVPGGIEEPFALAAGVGEDAVDAFERTSAWPVKAVEADDELSEYVPVLNPPPADEYMVWMRYPAMNGKVPWGLVAARVPRDHLGTWTTNVTACLSIQPMSEQVEASLAGQSLCAASHVGVTHNP